VSDAVPPHHRDAPETGPPSSQAETAEQALEPTPIDTPARAEDAQASQTGSAMAASTTTSLPERLRALEREGDVAADYLEGLLDIADFDGDIDMDVEGDRAMVSVVGADVDELVGENGQVLEALQELTRLAVVRETGERSRLMLDVGGFRARKRADLTALAQRSVEEARSSGDPVPLSPMTPFERKVVHDAVAAAGLRSESEGEEPERYVVVLPR
jgi:spoIIIJ-associated protein